MFSYRLEPLCRKTNNPLPLFVSVTEQTGAMVFLGTDPNGPPELQLMSNPEAGMWPSRSTLWPSCASCTQRHRSGALGFPIDLTKPDQELLDLYSRMSPKSTSP